MNLKFVPSNEGIRFIRNAGKFRIISRWWWQQVRKDGTFLVLPWRWRYHISPKRWQICNSTQLMEASSEVLRNDVKPTTDYDVTTHKQSEQSPQWEGQISEIYSSLNRDTLSTEVAMQRNVNWSNSEISTIQRQCLSGCWINLMDYVCVGCYNMTKDGRWL
jgi:hypothetical protein